MRARIRLRISSGRMAIRRGGDCVDDGRAAPLVEGAAARVIGTAPARWFSGRDPVLRRGESPRSENAGYTIKCATEPSANARPSIHKRIDLVGDPVVGQQ